MEAEAHDELRFRGLVIRGDMQVGIDRLGRPLRFTRTESVVLGVLIARSGRIVSRGALLDALTGRGSDANDRSVDFIIHRLRSKLGDNASDPLYIASRYGEGYVWLAARLEARPGNVLLSVRPAGGLENKHCTGILGAFFEALGTHFGADRVVAAGAAPARFALEINGWENNGELHMALVLREGTDGIATFHAAFALKGYQGDEVTALARSVADAAWRNTALGRAAGPSDLPMEIRLHEAERLFAQSPRCWMGNAEQLERQRRITPADPALAIARGLHLYSLLLLTGEAPIWIAAKDRRKMETEIESLVFDSLPGALSDPLLVLAAAKLLFFVNRGHLALAERLAEGAFKTTAAFAAAFSTLARMRAARGRFAEALALYDEAIARTDTASKFHIYTMVLKAIALMGAGERDALAAHCADLYAINPDERFKIGIMVADPRVEKLNQDLEAVLSGMSAQRARDVLDYLYDVAARHFMAQEHRRNIMAGATVHVFRAIGPDGVPARFRALVGVPYS